MANAQKFQTYVGGGLGGNFEDKFPHCARRDNGRLMLFVRQYYRINDLFSLGAEAFSLNRLGSFLGGIPVCNYDDPVTNTIEMNNNNLPGGGFLLRGRWTPKTKGSWQPFVDIGVGVLSISNNIFFRGIDRVEKNSFVFCPEIGGTYSRFTFAATILLGGKTPQFNGKDVNTNRTMILESISSQQLYLTLGFLLFRF
jgi:hypothetical protein